MLSLNVFDADLLDSCVQLKSCQKYALNIICTKIETKLRMWHKINWQFDVRKELIAKYFSTDDKSNIFAVPQKLWAVYLSKPLKGIKIDIRHDIIISLTCVRGGSGSGSGQ